MERKSAVAGLAILAACAFGGPASAADLGGDCCADLEERVAELEATTARKGNRVVSLAISGQVNQALYSWDNGVDSDTYVVTPTGNTLLRFTGTGRISENVTAGYYMEFAVYGEGQFLVDETSDEAASPNFSDGTDLQHNALYIDHVKLGRVWIGQTSGATDFITSINVANSAGIRSAGAQLYNGLFSVQGAAAAPNVKYKDLFGGDLSQVIGEGHRYDLVKYESPSIAGFKVSAAWGEDDMWDVALRYAGLVGGRVKLAAGIGYGSFTDVANNGCIAATIGESDADCHQLGASIGALDVPTGLFAHFAYGSRTDEVVNDQGDDGDREMFYIQAGIEKNWFGVGNTTIFGEYQQTDMGTYIAQSGGVSTTLFESAEAEVWGFGVVQSFDSAALDLYATFRHISSESTTDLAKLGVPNGTVENFQHEDWQEVMAGAKIKF
jgi:hypothetical protein